MLNILKLNAHTKCVDVDRFWGLSVASSKHDWCILVYTRGKRQKLYSTASHSCSRLGLMRPMIIVIAIKHILQGGCSLPCSSIATPLRMCSRKSKLHRRGIWNLSKADLLLASCLS